MVDVPLVGRFLKRHTVHCAVKSNVVVVLIVAAVFCIDSYYNKSYAQTEADQNTEHENFAVAIASEITAFLSPTIKQLENLDQKQLIDIFAGSDKAAMEAEAESLLKKFPTGLKVRLFKPGDYELDREAKPPLGFSSISMLRDIEKSTNNIAVEFHLAKSPDKHIVVIRKLEDAEKNLIGLIHLSLDATPLLKIIEQQDLDDTYIELTQILGDKSLTLVKKGVADLRIGEPVSAKVEGTAWEIIAWGGGSVAVSDTTSEIASSIGLTSLFSKQVIIVLLAVFALGVVGFLIVRRKKDDVGGVMPRMWFMVVLFWLLWKVHIPDWKN